jgi:hypothetical protein
MQCLRRLYIRGIRIVGIVQRATGLDRHISVSGHKGAPRKGLSIEFSTEFGPICPVLVDFSYMCKLRGLVASRYAQHRVRHTHLYIYTYVQYISGNV